MQTYPLQLLTCSPGYAQYFFVLLIKGQKQLPLKLRKSISGINRLTCEKCIN
jgi:hypothetical protein